MSEREQRGGKSEQSVVHDDTHSQQQGMHGPKSVDANKPGGSNNKPPQK
jgi:hypothetical protein